MSRLFRFSGPLPNLRSRYNVAPTQQVPIVRAARGDGSDRALLALLKPYPPDGMHAYPVSTVVNIPKNDKPECIEPAA